MKAIAHTNYGAPYVMQLREQEKPTPKDNEILIHVHAAVVTQADCYLRRGKPFITRLFGGLTKPKFIPGAELAGEIEAVGSKVKLFSKRDKVFALSPNILGAHAEYICLPEDGIIANMPSNMTYEESVAICEATTALTFLRDSASIKKGQQILINGASGAVGICAVQLAKYFGAEVTGVCSGVNIEMVRSAGADHVVDYTKNHFTKHNEKYDVIFDTVGKTSFQQCKHSLKENGVFLETVISFNVVFQTLWTRYFSNKKVIFSATGLCQNKDNLRFLKELAEAGRIIPIIDRHYTLEEIAEAHSYVEKGHKKGSVVISL